jgi:rare lipoprotein A
MYVPATPQPAAPLVAVGITAADPTIVTPAQTALHVRRGYRLNVLEGQATSVTGTLLEDGRTRLAGEIVSLQALGARGWKTLARARTGAKGLFRLNFQPRRLGSRWLRLSFAGTATELASHRRLGRLNVYRLAEASWYGGGGSLACGGELTSATMGVANKTLPCGTLVTLRYGGRTVRVPVVDRGPYVEGREFDLTEATKEALGFSGVGQVWSTS